MSVIDATRRPLDLVGDRKLPSEIEQSTVVDFAMQEQRYSNWCWAAVAASVAAYYGQDEAMSQCEIANLELKRTDCCEYHGDAKDVACNVTNVFASPLNRVDCLEVLTRFRRAEPSKVLEELKEGRPVCVRTVWRDGGAHFLTIVGYWTDTDTPMLVLDDPFWGRSEYSYDRFADDYQLLGGRWSDTYYTKRPSGDRAA